MKNALDDAEDDEDDEEARTTFKGAFIKGAILLIYMDCSNYYSKDWDSHRRVPFEIGKWRRRAIQEKIVGKKGGNKKEGTKRWNKKKLPKPQTKPTIRSSFAFPVRR